MHAQSLIVALLVLWCAGYALWTLLPSAARRALAARLLRWPLTKRLARPVQKALRSAGGCACDGCEANRPAAPASTITLHRRQR